MCVCVYIYIYKIVWMNEHQWFTRIFHYSHLSPPTGITIYSLQKESLKIVTDRRLVEGFKQKSVLLDMSTYETPLDHQWILCSEWVPSEWVQFYPYIAFSSQKVVSSESRKKCAQIKHGLQAKIVLNKCVSGFWTFWRKYCCGLIF